MVLALVLLAALQQQPAACFQAMIAVDRRVFEKVAFVPWASQSSSSSDEGAEDDDAPALPSGDWRAFRARLIETGLTTTTSEEEPEKKYAAPERRTIDTVSPANLELVKRQNAELAQEVMSAWAHEVGAAEVGGLLVRLPLELQLVVARETYWGKRLRQFAASEESRRAMREGGSAPGLIGDEESALGEVLLYRVAGRFLKLELERIARKGTVDAAGRLVIDPRVLGEADKALLDMRQDYLDSWQEVVLVLEHDTGAGSVGVALNRPAATRSNAPLSAGIVEALQRDETGSRPTASDFNTAFRDQIAAYVGCPSSRAPHRSPDGAVLVHGIRDLMGAREVAPGLGIFTGGAKAAVQRVIDGQADPLDFRFFIGTYKYAPGAINDAIRKGVYQPVACSSSLALKQCLSLPKPFWHEVRSDCSPAGAVSD